MQIVGMILLSAIWLLAGIVIGTETTKNSIIRGCREAKRGAKLVKSVKVDGETLQKMLEMLDEIEKQTEGGAPNDGRSAEG